MGLTAYETRAWEEARAERNTPHPMECVMNGREWNEVVERNQYVDEIKSEKEQREILSEATERKKRLGDRTQTFNLSLIIKVMKKTFLQFRYFPREQVQCRWRLKTIRVLWDFLGFALFAKIFF